MQSSQLFRFTLPQEPVGHPMDFEEIESMLIQQLEEKPDDEETLWHLARFYSLAHRHAESLAFLKKLVRVTEDLEKKAEYVLNLGRLMEQRGDYAAALKYYMEALSLEPCHTTTWYFIHNNLAFCLNQFGRYQEAERMARSAITIDAQRPNGFKNLGVALQGMGFFPEAAREYIRATQVEASDARALQLLEKLYRDYPEIREEILDIEEQLEQCREAVSLTEQIRRRLWGLS